MAKKKSETVVGEQPARTLIQAVEEFQQERPVLPVPICDICGKPNIYARKNPIVITGLGLRGHKKCWDALPEEEKQRRTDEWNAAAGGAE